MLNRTALIRSAFRAAVATTALAGALTACTPVKVGTAATVGDQRITMAQLDDTITVWKREFDADPQAGLNQQGRSGPAIQPYDQASVRRSTLYELIAYRIWDDVARDQGITVTAGQVDAFAAQNGGWQDLDSKVLARDLPRSHARDLLRSILIRTELLRRAGIDPDAQTSPSDPAAQQKAEAAGKKLGELYVAAAARLHIKVNPRFGTFSTSDVTLRPLSTGLSRSETPLSADTAAG